jgi:small Trp-rich protein
MNFIFGLQLVLITLKLAEIGVVKDWSWWLVLSPFLIRGTCVIIFERYIERKIK